MARSRGARPGEAKARDERGGASLNQSEAETVRVELARVRARFSVDPAIPSRLFAGAWRSPCGIVEEDEAEFVDALADCLSVGVPLDAAVASWVSGLLAQNDDPSEDDEGEVEISLSPLAEIHRAGARRTVVR
jgi:hypothetical protein